jgi:hypothetical protein
MSLGHLLRGIVIIVIAILVAHPVAGALRKAGVPINP